MCSESNEYNTLKDAINRNIIVFVRYGFKKRIEETQHYQGKLLSFDEFGLMLKADTKGEYKNFLVFFPWHNIDGIRIH